MAITTFNIPFNLAPAYSPFHVVLVSSEIAEPSFRYFIELLDELNGDALITRLNLVPRATDGIGYADISKVIQNLVSFQMPSGNVTENIGGYAKVKIQVGESYGVAYTYSDIQDNGGYVQLVGSTTTTYIVGDQINIEQDDDGSAMPNMTGLFTVLDVTGNDVTINRLWAEINYSAVGGTVTYADNRKTEFTHGTTESVEFMNGIFDFSEYPNYNEDDWTNTDSTDGIENLWTDCNRYGILNVKPTQDFFANTFKNFSGGYQVTIRTWNGSEYQYYYYTTPDETTDVIRLMGDFGSITPIGGAILPVIQDDTLDVRVRFGGSGETEGSKYYYFTIDHRCTINDYEIMFLDRKGGWGSFAFQLKSKQTVKGEKKFYQKELGIVTDEGFSYDLSDVGMQNYYSFVNEEWELNSNWMSEENSLYFEQLITSPKALIKIDNQYYGVEIITNDTERERFKNKHLIKKTITVRFANPLRING